MGDNVGSKFKFDGYTESELVVCGDRFLESCKSMWQETRSEAWTEHVLGWFTRTAADGVRVDARRARPTASSPRETQGEWLVDLVHTSYLVGDGTDYWKSAMKLEDDRAWSIHLALESEWGKSRAPGYTLEMVLYDASKLTALRAAVKVLVTSTPTGERGAEAKPGHDTELERAIVNLRRRTRDTAPWLWINLPNEHTPAGCRYVMFGNRRGTVHGNLAAKLPEDGRP
jgi:hypothetical protein